VAVERFAEGMADPADEEPEPLVSEPKPKAKRGGTKGGAK
jgi:hypothetical protein